MGIINPVGTVHDMRQALCVATRTVWSPLAQRANDSRISQGDSLSFPMAASFFRVSRTLACLYVYFSASLGSLSKENEWART